MRNVTVRLPDDLFCLLNDGSLQERTSMNHIMVKLLMAYGAGQVPNMPPPKQAPKPMAKPAPTPIPMDDDADLRAIWAE
jgi:hypothetical protein